MIWGLLKILPSEILRTTETIPEVFRGARNVYLMQLGEPRNSIRKLWRPGKHILLNCGWRPGIHPLVIGGLECSTLDDLGGLGNLPLVD